MKQGQLLKDPKKVFILLCLALSSLSCNVAPTGSFLGNHSNGFGNTGQIAVALKEGDLWNENGEDEGDEGAFQESIEPPPLTVNPRLDEIDEKYSKCRGIDIREMSVLDIQHLYDSLKLTSVELTKCYLERLDRMNSVLRVVIETNPDAMQEALRLDVERKISGERSLMHGIPVLIKESIGTADRTETTCGSPALVGLKPKRDAPVVTSLRKAGAIILGKANLPEFYGFLGTNLPEAWSGRGGLCRNSYNLSVSPAGSSAGSAVGVATNLVPVSLGSETDGSIIAPANVNGIVGMKPTFGLPSVAGIIPLAQSQDHVGPMAKTVMDTAILLDAMVSNEERPHFHPPSYAHHLMETQLQKPLRVGVLRYPFWDTSVVNSTDLQYELPQLENMLHALKKSPEFEVIDPVDAEFQDISTTKMYTVIFHEFKYYLNKYLQEDVVNQYPLPRPPNLFSSSIISTETPEAYLSGISPYRRIKTLEDVIKYNEEHPTPEGYNQDYLLMAQATDGISNRTYIEARDSNRALAKEYLDYVFDKYNLDAIVTPSEYRNEGISQKKFEDFPVNGFTVACIAGYPTISIPAGIGLKEVPFGIMFTAKPFDEPTLLQVAQLAEQINPQRVTPMFLI